jgi:hypothetical protein
LKLNKTYQLLVYADDVNVYGENVHTVKKNRHASVVVSKRAGLEVHAEKTKYMVVPRNQNAGQNHNLKYNKSFGRVKEFKYF